MKNLREKMDKLREDNMKDFEENSDAGTERQVG